MFEELVPHLHTPTLFVTTHTLPFLRFWQVAISPHLQTPLTQVSGDVQVIRAQGSTRNHLQIPIM